MTSTSNDKLDISAAVKNAKRALQIRTGFVALIFKAWSKSNRFKIGLLISSFIILIGVLAPLIAPYPRDGLGYVPEDALQKIRLPPSQEHLFGTDTRGRDIFSRVVFGARSALIQIFLVVSSSLLIGLFMGVIAAYYKGLVETVINYLIELFMSIPAIVIALALRLILGSGLFTVVLALIITWWSWYGRVTYIYSRSIVEMDYVLLAKLSGVSGLKIIFRHVVRNASPPVLVQAVTDLGSVLLEASAINFLGLGLPPDSPEWGVIMQEGIQYLSISPWISVFPGIFILITALGFSLIGDSLREEVDPKLRRRWRLWF
ncbi:ABC transporter permease [Thermosphaera chiliense]|uniref:ABC transporter permease n=1 Tax=Thermosphaera chiliense TaxID=3402707 RepID=A0A7M1UPJ8_9CREN|nr:ABC transporter permease [Thermosphaera aggregans]QOR94198.1 ABC transporter permease [Thermosphaera aggregans]